MEISNILIGLGAIMALYVLYRLFSKPAAKNQFEEELNHVLSSDQYKVKGRFE